MCMDRYACERKTVAVLGRIAEGSTEAGNPEDKGEPGRRRDWWGIPGSAKAEAKFLKGVGDLAQGI